MPEFEVGVEDLIKQASWNYGMTRWKTQLRPGEGGAMRGHNSGIDSAGLDCILVAVVNNLLLTRLNGRNAGYMISSVHLFMHTDI